MAGLCWAHILDCTDTNVPRSTLSNAVRVLQHDPQFAPDALYYDEFLDRIIVKNSDAREWRDDDDTRATVYMQEAVGMLTIPEGHVASAVRLVARQRTRNCVWEYLDALAWDGVERIAHALEDWWGVEPSESQPCDYVRAVSANLFLSMVARILRPGCQLDTMTILEGPQGIGKSKSLRVLGGAYYMLAAESVTSKDFFQLFPGKWLAEIGELDAMARAERERVKLVISTPVDRYRSSYGRHAADHPRRCVFVGTTNRDDYGNDDTGLRRFLPVRCGDIDLIGLAAARDQLFAEAVVAIRRGDPWWVTPDALTLRVQRDRQSEDVWTPLVLDYLVGKPEVHIHDVLTEACKLRPGELSHAHKLRVGSILRLHGWTKNVRRRNGKQVKTWVAPEDE